jgi:hypothetical protein
MIIDPSRADILVVYSNYFMASPVVVHIDDRIQFKTESIFDLRGDGNSPVYAGVLLYSS